MLLLQFLGIVYESHSSVVWPVIVSEYMYSCISVISFYYYLLLYTQASSTERLQCQFHEFNWLHLSVFLFIYIIVFFSTLRNRGTSNREGQNITFVEFIRFISEAGHGTQEQQNEHWRPMHELCQPCSVQYDFIGRFENLREDTEYLLQWLGLAGMIKEFPASDRSFNTSRYDPQYISQLNHTDILAFYAKYLPDFLLFDYSFK